MIIHFKFEVDLRNVSNWWSSCKNYSLITDLPCYCWWDWWVVSQRNRHSDWWCFEDVAFQLHQYNCNTLFNSASNWSQSRRYRIKSCKCDLLYWLQCKTLEDMWCAVVRTFIVILSSWTVLTRLNVEFVLRFRVILEMFKFLWYKYC